MLPERTIRAYVMKYGMRRSEKTEGLSQNFLCKVKSFGDRNLTQDELEDFHLSTLKLTYEEAICEYEKRRETKPGRLIANRELPVLFRAKELMGSTY